MYELTKPDYLKKMSFRQHRSIFLGAFFAVGALMLGMVMGVAAMLMVTHADLTFKEAPAESYDYSGYFDDEDYYSARKIVLFPTELTIFHADGTSTTTYD